MNGTERPGRRDGEWSHSAAHVLDTDAKTDTDTLIAGIVADLAQPGETMYAARSELRRR